MEVGNLQKVQGMLSSDLHKTSDIQVKAVLKELAAEYATVRALESELEAHAIKNKHLKNKKKQNKTNKKTRP